MGACSSTRPRSDGVAPAKSEATGPLVRTAGKQKYHTHLPTKDESLTTGQFILQNHCKLAEVYELNEQKLGEGTFGCVVLGRHKATGVPRAIKKIAKAHVKDLQGLRKEIDMMKKMDHPNIIRLFETFEDRNHIYLVMELCEGGELFDRVVAAGKLGEAETALVIRDLLRAVFYMHQQDIVHRDLKPENFLLQNKGEIEGNVLKLIDFGTARHADQRTLLRTKIGTPYYVAPQVVKGHYDRQCDVWSVGAIMYTLLSGSPPFTGPSEAEIMAKVRVGRVTFKESAWRAVSEEAKHMVRQLMRMAPNERYTAEQALSDAWLKAQAPAGPALCMEDDFLQRWHRYKRQSRIRKAALYIIAGQLHDSETKELRDCFTALDSDGNGRLSLGELRQGLEQVGLARSDSDLVQLMGSVDQDGSGSINYTEFIAASIDGSKAINRDVCRTAFGLFDRDGDGEISTAEMAQVLDRGRVKAGTVDMMRKADSNYNGKIDFEEFMAMMETRGPAPTAARAMGGA